MTSFVYFIKPIGMDGPIKIGCSKRPMGRLANLTLWSPSPLEILATIPGDAFLERKLHVYFASAHLHSEWFAASPELQALIAGLINGKTLSEIVDLTHVKQVVIKRKLSAEQRARRSIGARVGWAMRRYTKEHKRMLFETDRLRQAIDAYARVGGPSPEDVRLVEDFITDPGAHGLTHEQKYPDVRRIA
jgi:hypothetical protein